MSLFLYQPDYLFPLRLGFLPEDAGEGGGGIKSNVSTLSSYVVKPQRFCLRLRERPPLAVFNSTYCCRLGTTIPGVEKIFFGQR